MAFTSLSIRSNASWLASFARLASMTTAMSATVGESKSALRDRAVRFFFQAEDGIRDGHVTGVQTCALPIYSMKSRRAAFRPQGEKQYRESVQKIKRRGNVPRTPGVSFAICGSACRQRQRYFLKIGRASCRERVWIKDVERSFGEHAAESGGG